MKGHLNPIDLRLEAEVRAARRNYRGVMASNENPPASVAVWYFVGATFVAALPMLMFPEMHWLMRLGSLALALALIAAGGWQLRRDKRAADRPIDQAPRG